MESFSEIASYLLRQSWQLAAVFVLVGAACWALKSASAHWRYLLWLVVLVKCIVPPLLVVPVAVLPQAEPPAGEVGAVLAGAAAPAETVAPGAAALPPTAGPGEPGRDPAPDTALADHSAEAPAPAALSPVEWLVVAWMASAAAFALLVGLKAVRIHRQLTRTRRPAPRRLQQEMAELAGRLGLRSSPRVWLVDGFGQPFVWGLLRGVIYVPAGFSRAGSDQDRRGVLTHELAHVRRWDAAVNAVQVLVQVPFFFHPLVWWANRKIRREREKCCDEMAIAALAARPKQYSAAIVDCLVNERHPRRRLPSLAVAGPVKNLEERIRTIMRPERTFHRRPSWPAVVTAVLAAAIVLPAAVTPVARAQQRVEAPAPAASAKPASCDGEIKLDTDIPLKLELWSDPRPPVRKSRFVVVRAGSIRFQRSSGELHARLTLQCSSWPKADYRAQVALADAAGKVVARAAASFQAQGTIIRLPLWMKHELDFSFGKWGDVSAATRFTLTVAQVEAAAEAVGAKTASCDGAVKLDADIPLKLELFSDPRPPVRKDKFVVVQAGSIRFEKAGGLLVAKMKLGHSSWPKARYEAKVELMDSAGKFVVGSAAFFEASGMIERIPLWRPRDLGFSFGKWDDVSLAVRFRLTLSQAGEGEQGEASEQSRIPEGAVKLGYVDDTAESRRSLGASGHAVVFSRPGKARFVEAVQIFASRYGTPEAPKEDFHLYLLNAKYQVLADLRYPYGMIQRGDMRWYTLKTPPVEVPPRFHVALAFNPHRTKGVYLGLDESVESSHSYAGLPDSGYEKLKDKQDWMVQAYLTTTPSRAKDARKLADWRPPVAAASFAGCLEFKVDTGRSQGKQSYGGRGPALRIDLKDARLKDARELAGFRVYASRYGSGYDPQKTLLKLALLDAAGKIHRRQSLPYALFSYRERWVDLPLAKPLALRDWPEGQSVLTVALDPEATQYKGIYFHYNKNPRVSHSLVGTSGRGFKPVADREWMIRAYFRSGQPPSGP